MTPGGAGEVTLYVDGASRGNPGPAGIGIRMLAGDRVTDYCDAIGRTTNNTAEYKALIRGLHMAREAGARRVSVVSDSELMVRQLLGSYRVKNTALQALHREAKALAQGFECFRIRHVLRGQNGEADRLANLGIDKGAMASGPDGRARKGEESPSSTGQDAG